MAEVEESTLGLRHTHVWEPVTSRGGLQTAHDRLRWDVNVSRIITVDSCTVCGEFHRESIAECTLAGCESHAICARPWR